MLGAEQTESLPSVLYKYFGPDRVDVLQNGLIRYSPLGAFNDPFEGRPEITSLDTEAGIRDSLNAIAQEEAQRFYEQLPEKDRAVRSYEQWKQLFLQHLEANESANIQTINGYTSLVQTSMKTGIDRGLGALCLSEVQDSLLMWAHYGAGHAGFALEFNAHHPHFNESRDPKDPFRRLRQVDYRETRPSGMLVELEEVAMFLVKSTHWRYEREWRIFRALSEADKVVSGNPFDIHLFRIPLSALQAVILGARASLETVGKVTSILRANASLRHVRLKRARADSSHFLLRIKDEAF